MMSIAEVVAMLLALGGRKLLDAACDCTPKLRAAIPDTGRAVREARARAIAAEAEAKAKGRK